MQSSTGNEQVQRIDQLLATLEQRAAQAPAPQHLWTAFAQTASQVLPGGSLWVVYWLGDGWSHRQWLVEPMAMELASQDGKSKADSASIQQDLVASWLNGLQDPLPLADYRTSTRLGSHTWCLASRSSPRAAWGALLWQAPGELNVSVAMTALELLGALASIWEEYWQATVGRTRESIRCSVMHAMHHWPTSDRNEAMYHMVNDLASAAGAQRCVLFDCPTGSRPRLLAASGPADVKLQSDGLKNWLRAVAQAEVGRIISDGSSSMRWLVLALHGHRRLAWQWSDTDRALASMPIISTLAPSLGQAWHVVSREGRLWRMADRFTAARWKLLTALVGGLCLVMAVWVTRHWPVSLNIQCSGYLEPIEQSWVFAPADGFVDQMLVNDRQLVDQGQRLVSVASPNLNIQMQSLASEVETWQQKRLALDIQLSESNSSTEGGNREARRIAGEILDIDSRLAGLREQRQALEEQLAQLTVTSRIAGRVVGHDLVAQLQQKPVRAGEYLLRVVNEAGAWQLELHVAESDLGHVQRALDRADGRLGVRFTIVGKPQPSHQAVVTLVNSSITLDSTNARAIRVLGEVSKADLGEVLVGSQVLASIDTGPQPWWFVLARPMIESLQRRGWL